VSTTFLALYRGDSVSAAKLIALTAKPDLVRDFAGRLLAEDEDEGSDPVLEELERGRRQALQLVRGEAE
jgi:hypothetical protein